MTPQEQAPAADRRAWYYRCQLCRKARATHLISLASIGFFCESRVCKSCCDSLKETPAA